MLQNKAELNRGSFLCNLNNTTSLVEVTTFSFTPSGSYWEWRRSSRHVWCLSDPFKFGYNRKSKHWVDVFSRPRVTALSLVTLLEFFYWQATPFVIRNTTVLIHVLRLVSVGYELFYDPCRSKAMGQSVWLQRRSATENNGTTWCYHQCYQVTNQGYGISQTHRGSSWGAR